MKVLSVIQARVNSIRLPGKVLMEIEGKPILSHIIDFLKLSKMTDEIVVATTTLEDDSKIQQLSNELKVKCFRGSPYDVLDRFYKTAKIFDADIIIRLTADNPLVDPILIDKVIKTCKEKNYDYVSNIITQTFPIGYSPCEAISFTTLENLFINEKDSLSREHVTYKIRKNTNLFKTQEIKAPEHLSRPNWRLTIDYKEDLILMRKIFQNLYSADDYIHYDELVKFLDKHNNLLKINNQYTL